MISRATVLLASALSVLPMLAFADDSAPPAAAPAAANAGAAVAAPIEQICQADLANLCKDAGDKRGKQFRCLADNKDKLSADCGTAVKTMQEKRAAMRAACKEDAAKSCPDSKGGELMACLRGKLSDLSKPCADAMAAMPQQAAKQ